ncbi:hypothetical protein Tco_0038071 [Tanacetum coccineum]
MTQSTFKSSTDKLAWQILDWGDMMRSGVTTRIPEKLVCRRTYQARSYQLRPSAATPKERPDKRYSPYEGPLSLE